MKGKKASKSKERPLGGRKTDYILLECPRSHRIEIVAPRAIQAVLGVLKLGGVVLTCERCDMKLYRVATEPWDLFYEEGEFKDKVD